MCAVLAAAPLKVEAAITCGQVTSGLMPCIGYLQNGGTLPPACCSGIKSLNNAAKTTPDRQATCNCLKNVAKQFPKNVVAGAAGLPGKCGVDVPYKISPSTDCSKYVYTLSIAS